MPARLTITFALPLQQLVTGSISKVTSASSHLVTSRGVQSTAQLIPVKLKVNMQHPRPDHMTRQSNVQEFKRT
eukprot:2380782-Amphidinium_carterae.1